MSVKTKTALVLTGFWCLTLTSVGAFSRQAVGSGNSGEQRIVLPLELVAGQPATLAILARNGRIAPGVKVVLSNGEVLTTDESGRAHFLQPTGSGVVFARIEGAAEREAADVLPRDAGSTRLQVTSMPRFLALENHFTIGGTGFQGDADQNRVEVSDKRILILASSPVQLIAMPPANSAPGPANLLLTEGTMEVAAKVTFIDVTTGDSGSVAIRRGKKSSIAVHALGTIEPVDLIIQNLSPKVVQFPKGDEERVRTAGGADNSVNVELKAVGTGSFSYSASLEDASVGMDAPRARDFLEAAARIAGPDVASRVAVMLRLLRADRVDAVKVRNDLDEISSQGGSEDFRALLRAARRALAGE